MKHNKELGRIIGNLEIFSETKNGKRRIYIHGDPQGLESLGKLLHALSKVNQELFKIDDGWREHVHLCPDWNLSLNSNETIIGRLDAKGTGDFPQRFKKRKKRKIISIT